MPGEPIPPPDNLRPVDPNALGVPKAPPEEITPVPSNLSETVKPGQSTQETKPTLLDTEWKRILNLGEKSFLDLTPEEIAELQSLKVKGKGLLGDGFNQELSRRNAEAKQQKRDRLDDAFRKITEEFNTGAQSLTQTTQKKIEEGDEGMRRAETAMRQNIANIGEGEKKRTYEEVLAELRKDPQHLQAVTEIEWLDLQMGKPMQGVTPELQKRIDNLRQRAPTMIMTNLTGYKKEEAALKAEFLKSRGLNLPDKPTT